MQSDLLIPDKVLVSYHILPPVPIEGESGSNASRELAVSLAGAFPVRSSSIFSFCPRNFEIEQVSDVSLLAFASAESNPPPHLAPYAIRPGKKNETFFFCLRGSFYIVTVELFHLENPPDKFHLTEQERISPADPHLLQKKPPKKSS